MGFIHDLLEGPADFLGVPASGLTFLASLLLSAPICYKLKDFLNGQPAYMKHIAFTLAGVFFSVCNYGIDTSHLFITIVANYFLLLFTGGTAMSVALSFVLNMGYLLVAYVFVSSDIYEIIWTTPQCVITLRMIGIAFDLMDGNMPKEKLSKEQQQLYISKAPTLLELLSACFYPGGFFAGPQFSFRMFLEFVNEEGTYKPLYSNDPPDRVKPALKAMATGMTCVVIYALCNNSFGPMYISSSEFENSAMIIKVIRFCLYGYNFYFKYVGFWLLTESVCICGGLAYNGQDKDGQHRWDAVIGARLYLLLTANAFRDLIRSFNLTTNLWTARYVYKRCRFLGNRHLSQAISLLFLAIWHGFFVGYFLCFQLEMIYVMVEDQVVALSEKIPALRNLVNKPSAKVPVYIITKAWMTFFWAYAITPFIFLRLSKIHHVWRQFYYCGHVIYFSWVLLYFLFIVPQLKRMAKKEEKDKQKKSE
ncbi:Lysophospholipid acyltransferase 5 [Holothuria leucospilota]|uniref:Lysophospholipid acyltransferase 5 n=1 Tax=Holothuria leucospilota TaxID=206669 RepID=A0A9Q1BDK7_HOLLE|nr:Lysophospholipid acyltransferase 5 [Holothuria leucospilota]